MEQLAYDGRLGDRQEPTPAASKLRVPGENKTGFPDELYRHAGGISKFQEHLSSSDITPRGNAVLSHCSTGGTVRNESWIHLFARVPGSLSYFRLLPYLDIETKYSAY